MANSKKRDAFEILGEALKPPPPPPPSKKNDTWMPHMTVEQKELFNSEEPFILCWGEKGGAKTWGILDKMVKHLYDNENGFAVIGVRVRSMANKGGAWDKLITYILPEWKKGLGLNYSGVCKDTQHNEFVWIENRFGTWSCVVLISAPHASQLKDRMPGYEPSFVFWDELTKCDSEEYFKAPSIQLGRRKGITGSQQFIAACNPDGPSHWVYKKWFEEPFNEVTGEWDPEFKNIYFPVSSNAGNLRAGYLDSLKKIYKNDPIGSARMIAGEWVDQPSGEALFRDLFVVVRHVVSTNEEGIPDPKKRIMPHKDYPIIIGLDPGSVFNAFIFMQWLPVTIEDGTAPQKWVIFDEAVTVRKRVNYRDYIPIIMRKVKFWREVVDGKMPQVWISDNSAFNQYRAAQGSFDVMELERYYEASRAKYGMEPLKIKPCPKGPGSVIARVQLMQTLLSQDQIVVSSGCPKFISMLNHLEGNSTKEGEQPDPEKLFTPKRSDFVHTFDAATYPMLFASISPTALIPNHGLMSKVA